MLYSVILGCAGDQGMRCMQEWLAMHGPFNAIIDGANVACFGSSGNFYFSKIASTLRLLAHTHPHLRPLVVRPGLFSA